MNPSVIFKRMPTAAMQISELVPEVGELIMDATSSKLKVGDGKTAVKDLPWVDYGIDSAKEEISISIGAKAFLEDHIDLIDNYDYDTLYSRIATAALAQEITRVLLKVGLNPKPYLTNIPNSIRHILEPEGVWEEDRTTPYTRSEMDAILDEWNAKLFMQMGIPQNIIKVGN